MRECLAALAHPSITPATPKQPLPATLLLTLQNLRETTETERRLAERILQQAEQEDAGLQADMTAYEKARHEANRLELALQTALHHKDSAEQEAVRTERERCSLLEQYTALRQTVLQGLRPYGIESLAVDGLEALLHSLSERRERWVSREKRRDLLQQKMSALELESRHLASRLLDMEKELGKQREAARSCRRIGKSCGSTGGGCSGTNLRMRKRNGSTGSSKKPKSGLKASAKPSMPPNSALLG